ncbi:MAG: IS1595 family transposase, partial [Oscillospiraceae bacterium]|nr:IS1595 family transposase [Oscillospiraceae bacterium]
MAKKKIMSLIEFNEKYGTEEACENHLIELRKKNGMVCPKCGCTEFYYIGSRKLFQCMTCRNQISLTSGTVMHRTHLPLRTWFHAIYFLVSDKRGCSASQLAKLLNIGYKTAWFLLHRIRYAMSERNRNYMLSGIVEVDDTYYGSTKKGSKRGIGTDKIKIAVAVSKDENGKPKYVQMNVLKNLKGVTVGQFAREHIKEGSIVESDAYQSYRKPLANRYFHKFDVFNADKDMLKWLHTIVGNAKLFIDGTFHGLGGKYIQ